LFEFLLVVADPLDCVKYYDHIYGFSFKTVSTNIGGHVDCAFSLKHAVGCRSLSFDMTSALKPVLSPSGDDAQLEAAWLLQSNSEEVTSFRICL